jgi:hypothetical protein
MRFFSRKNSNQISHMSKFEQDRKKNSRFNSTHNEIEEKTKTITPIKNSNSKTHL